MRHPDRVQQRDRAARPGRWGLAVLGLAAVLAVAKMKSGPRQAAETDPQYPYLRALQLALDKGDERRLKQAVNSLHVPAAARPPNGLMAANEAEVAALAPRVGYRADDPAFQKFLKLYREAPRISAERRGYAEFADMSGLAFEAVRKQLAPDENIIFGGADSKQRVVIVTARRIYFDGAWHPVKETRYPSSRVFEAEGGTAMAVRSSGEPELSFRGESFASWPLRIFDADIFK